MMMMMPPRNLLGGLLLLLLCGVEQVAASFPDCVNGPMKDEGICDVSLSPVKRARALVDLMTVEEKMANMGSVSPGVPRLGLPGYQWWQEALHGIASSPGVNFSNNGAYSSATSFPQPILMGAAFDDDLIRAVGTVIATEARTFSNANRSGLDFWTPNINPFRDPRWGRGQETPGEDPFHLARYVRALIEGLQGGEGRYWRVVATCKHFAGYDMESWNGNLRYQFDAQISLQDLSEYYTPAFQSCARDAHVGAFMCTYNALNGVPTCADPYLLQTLLREHWGWGVDEEEEEGGWVTSDCDSIQNIYLPHEWAGSREQAVADALNAGTDLNCGTYYQRYLPGALAQGLINETVLDRALVRQYASLVRVGYFDPPAMQPYRQLTYANVNTPEAQALAYRAAVSGITLLKNDGTLPLNLANQTNTTTIALIGSWANATTQMQGNYGGVAPHLRSPLWAAQQLPGVTVRYAAGVGGQGDPTTNSWDAAFAAASASSTILIADGIDNAIESEGRDRDTLAWTGAQLDLIRALAALGKPTIILAMGGGQLDSAPLRANPNISALLWAGYPGQEGGRALLDVLTGAAAPAGRLPVTQYPASYAAALPMTDMALRPHDGGGGGRGAPGRTYRWYNGTPTFPFGFGLHYTSFAAAFTLPGANSSIAIPSIFARCNATYPDTCGLLPHPFTLNVTNTGARASDYVALLFARSADAGPAPRPRKVLVAYARLHDLAPGETREVGLDVTVGALARADERGNKVLWPGRWEFVLDVGDGEDEGGLASMRVQLTGEERVVERWPQPPPLPRGKERQEQYFVGGFGSEGGL